MAAFADHVSVMFWQSSYITQFSGENSSMMQIQLRILKICSKTFTAKRRITITAYFSRFLTGFKNLFSPK